MRIYMTERNGKYSKTYINLENAIAEFEGWRRWGTDFTSGDPNRKISFTLDADPSNIFALGAQHGYISYVDTAD